MSALLTVLDLLIAFTRVAALVLALLALAAALLDRAVRKRQVNPFGTLGRISRRVVDPLLAPFERRLLASGRTTDAAAWWMLGTVVIGSLLLLALLGFLRGQLVATARAVYGGPLGIVVLLVTWAFSIVQIALLVRVFASWFRVNPFSWWMRLAHALTEWILRPLRQLLPPLGGMIDLSPLIAWFLLGLLEGVVLSLLR
jgi:YggT family protein